MHFRSIADHNGNLKSLAVLFLQFSVENQNKSHQNDNKNPDKMGSAVKRIAVLIIFFCFVLVTISQACP